MSKLNNYFTEDILKTLEDAATTVVNKYGTYEVESIQYFDRDTKDLDAIPLAWVERLHSITCEGFRAYYKKCEKKPFRKINIFIDVTGKQFEADVWEVVLEKICKQLRAKLVSFNIANWIDMTYARIRERQERRNVEKTLDIIRDGFFRLKAIEVDHEKYQSMKVSPKQDGKKLTVHDQKRGKDRAVTNFGVILYNGIIYSPLECDYGKSAREYFDELFEKCGPVSVSILEG